MCVCGVEKTDVLFQLGFSADGPSRDLKKDKEGKAISWVYKQFVLCMLSSHPIPPMHAGISKCIYQHIGCGSTEGKIAGHFFSLNITFIRFGMKHYWCGMCPKSWKLQIRDFQEDKGLDSFLIWNRWRRRCSGKHCWTLITFLRFQNTLLATVEPDILSHNQNKVHLPEEGQFGSQVLEMCRFLSLGYS